jgi:tRNA/rRNA methyltransferase
MVRNLRSLFQRAQCTEQELRTLHGVVTAFAGPRERGESTRGSGRAGWRIAR